MAGLIYNECGEKENHNMIVQCPFCHFKEMVPEEYAGMVGECSKCGKEYRLPYAIEKLSSVSSFLLGFFLSIVGILLVLVLDKGKIKNALFGLLASFVFWLFFSVFIIGGATCASRTYAHRAASAASALSEEEGDRSRSAVDSISEDSLRQLGED